MIFKKRTDRNKRASSKGQMSTCSCVCFFPGESIKHNCGLIYIPIILYHPGSPDYLNWYLPEEKDISLTTASYEDQLIDVDGTVVAFWSVGFRFPGLLVAT